MQGTRNPAIILNLILLALIAQKKTTDFDPGIDGGLNTNCTFSIE